MPKFNWSKSGNYTADPARYQRGDDEFVHPKRSRRRKQSAAAIDTSRQSSSKKVTTTSIGVQGEQLSKAIKRCRALDQMHADRQKEAAARAKLREEGERKLLDQIPQPAPKSCDNDYAQRKRDKYFRPINVVTRKENHTEGRRRAFERIGAVNPVTKSPMSIEISQVWEKALGGRF